MRRGAERLVVWYRSNARDLPWRRSRDPWAILVSELMLQQTRVETVLPRFEEFLERFPDPPSMAAAPVEDVLAAWSGLGYYRRARNLHRLAVVVTRDHGGRLPAEHEALLELPGVGAYTAAAVGSIAFGLPRLTIDGNVERVLSRVVGSADSPKRAAVRRAFESLMAPALDSWPPGDVNQALMELGATVCLSRTPSCHICPLQPNCVAFRDGSQATIPPPRRQTVHGVEEAAAVIEHRGRYLLFRGQRPGALRDMWEFPTLDSRLRDDDLGLAAGLSRYLQQHGVSAARLDRVGTIRHGITNRRIRCQVYGCETDVATTSTAPAAESASTRVERRWAGPAEIARLPVGATVLKILRLLGG